MKAYGGSTIIGVLILSLGSRWRLTLRPAHPQVSNLRCPVTRRLGAPRSNLDGLKKRNSLFQPGIEQWISQFTDCSLCRLNSQQQPIDENPHLPISIAKYQYLQ